MNVFCYTCSQHRYDYSIPIQNIDKNNVIYVPETKYTQILLKKIIIGKQVKVKVLVIHKRTQHTYIMLMLLACPAPDQTN